MIDSPLLTLERSAIERLSRDTTGQRLAEAQAQWDSVWWLLDRATPEERHEVMADPETAAILAREWWSLRFPASTALEHTQELRGHLWERVAPLIPASLQAAPLHEWVLAWHLKSTPAALASDEARHAWLGRAVGYQCSADFLAWFLDTYPLAQPLDTYAVPRILSRGATFCGTWMGLAQDPPLRAVLHQHGCDPMRADEQGHTPLSVSREEEQVHQLATWGAYHTGSVSLVSAWRTSLSDEMAIAWLDGRQQYEQAHPQEAQSPEQQAGAAAMGRVALFAAIAEARSRPLARQRLRPWLAAAEANPSAWRLPCVGTPDKGVLYFMATSESTAPVLSQQGALAEWFKRPHAPALWRHETYPGAPDGMVLWLYAAASCYQQNPGAAMSTRLYESLTRAFPDAQERMRLLVQTMGVLQTDAQAKGDWEGRFKPHTHIVPAWAWLANPVGMDSPRHALECLLEEPATRAVFIDALVRDGVALMRLPPAKKLPMASAMLLPAQRLASERAHPSMTPAEWMPAWMALAAYERAYDALLRQQSRRAPEDWSWMETVRAHGACAATLLEDPRYHALIDAWQTHAPEALTELRLRQTMASDAGNPRVRPRM